MKIDMFNHIVPKKFLERMSTLGGKGSNILKRASEIPALADLDARFRIMDAFGDYVQVISLPSPPLESLGTADVSPELAQIANDGMAELVAKHPDRFPGFVAAVPISNPNASLIEIERAVLKLGASGIQIYTNVNGRPLDEPAFLPIFEKMAELDRPIWVHPARGAGFPDYQTEQKSKFELWWVFGWPYHALFASGSPFDPEKGPGYIRETIRCIEELSIPAEERKKIYEDNGRKLFRLRLG